MPEILPLVFFFLDLPGSDPKESDLFILRLIHP
jgi:hypothetical protein